MARKTHDEISEIMKREGVDRIFSWSKWDTFFTSPYEYFLKYIKKVPEDRQDCIYPVTGGLAHDILEKFYKGDITYEEMLSCFEDGWMTSYDIAQLKFDRNDEQRNESIGEKYYADLHHFFKNHKKLPYKVMLEQFAKIKVGNDLFQGYIDVCFKDDDGYYQIIDWKTSSIYKGTTALEKCGQLVLYAMGLMQQGIPRDKIKIGWNFLKYVKVQQPMKKKDENGNYIIKERTIERFEIGDKLKTNAKMWLKECGYSNDEIEQYLEDLVIQNSIDALPDDVKSKYVINDCYEYVDLTDELLANWVTTIANVISQIDFCEKAYAATGDEKVWWDTEESVQKESYYFATLSGYSPNLHLPYKAYLEKLEAQANGTDMFGGVGTAADDNDTPPFDMDTNESSTVDDDLSWLETL